MVFTFPISYLLTLGVLTVSPQSNSKFAAFSLRKLLTGRNPKVSSMDAVAVP